LGTLVQRARKPTNEGKEKRREKEGKGGTRKKTGSYALMREKRARKKKKSENRKSGHEIKQEPPRTHTEKKGIPGVILGNSVGRRDTAFGKTRRASTSNSGEKRVGGGKRARQQGGVGKKKTQRKKPPPVARAEIDGDHGHLVQAVSQGSSLVETDRMCRIAKH